MYKYFAGIVTLLSILLPFPTLAQTAEENLSPAEKMNRHGVLNTIEIAANIGTTGLGLELATPITEWVKLRAGVDWMPPFKKQLEFDVINYKGDQPNDRFDRIEELMYQLSGLSLNREIKLDSKPTMTTFRLMVDVYPFKNNRHWHFTAGFFAGGRSIGSTVNALDEMPTLLAISMYETLYKDVSSDNVLENLKKHPLFGQMNIDQMTAEAFQQRILPLGELGVQAGNNPDGTPCLIMPDTDGTIRLKSMVNRIRPYVGFGYGGALSRDGKWQASFDAGVQFWGGVPKVTAYDGTVINDLSNLSGKTRSYIDLMKAMPVYPTLDFRISYRF